MQFFRKCKKIIIETRGVISRFIKHLQNIHPSEHANYKSPKSMIHILLLTFRIEHTLLD